ncbi:hypothetical protein IW261DRAFT_1421738 [Armillaria novae-zelandiae]|uniref:Uncharacterized protein n=1 Tax=Armillaria novae-zelandiae TaxID=153914 RepID=A0AA39P2M9_9AGAR|nr:hypothetical protein IW261DRAFT_1421738 [Armillaria novae-zelandiae]
MFNFLWLCPYLSTGTKFLRLSPLDIPPSLRSSPGGKTLTFDPIYRWWLDERVDRYLWEHMLLLRQIQILAPRYPRPKFLVKRLRPTLEFRRAILTSSFPFKFLITVWMIGGVALIPCNLPFKFAALPEYDVYGAWIGGPLLRMQYYDISSVVMSQKLDIDNFEPESFIVIELPRLTPEKRGIQFIIEDYILSGCVNYTKEHQDDTATLFEGQKLTLEKADGTPVVLTLRKDHFPAPW